MSSSAQEVGVVVIGLGIAGKVRVRDLKEETCGLKLKGVVSRRPVEDTEVKCYSLEEALADKDVQAVMISTEPAYHEEYVRKALESGKHVLVEYPLALSSDTAKELYSLAEEKGLILHEENIALLTQRYGIVKQKAMSTQLKSATYSLKGKKNGWVEDFAKSGLPFVCAVSGLQVMITLFGELNVTGGSIEYHDGGYTTTANLQTAQGSPISMTLGRYSEMSRSKQEVYTFVDGEELEPDKMDTTKGKPQLFAKDMHLFYETLQEGKISEERKKLTIYSLQVAEKIHSFY